MATPYRKGQVLHSVFAAVFLKSFGKFQVASLTEDVVPADKLMLEMIQDMQRDLRGLRRQVGSDSRAGRGGSSAPGQAIFGGAVKKWVSETGCDEKDLKGNSDFYSFVEEFIDARNNFSSKSEFIESLDKYLARYGV